MTVALGLLAVVLLTAATGYFVAQEFAYVTADRLALQEAAREGDKKAARAVKVLEHLSFMLSGAQLGITVTTLVVGFIAKPAIAGVIEPLLGPLGVPEAMAAGISLGIAFVLAIVVQMILGELFPKNLSLAKPETLARVLAPSTLVYLKLARPVIVLFDSAANRLLRAVGIEPVEELHHGATLEELGHIIGESEKHLAHDHVDLLERALVFSDRTASNAMVPRVDVTTIEASATISEITEVIARQGHTHYPVVGERVDDIVGVIGLPELMPVPDGDPRLAGDLARPALVVPTSLALPAVFAQMRACGDEIACVIDEYGGFAGLITLEDVAEELVGEISDEDDGDEPLARVINGWWHTDAGLRIDEIAQLTGLHLPEGDYDTVAGLLQQRLGRIAGPGDLIEADGLAIEVISVDHHVAEKIRLRSVPVAAAEPVREGAR
ncbi:CBS domain containing-hemolysin-like protein [Actinocorallia herbida]|uniref:CBS domain containing-hemolysin-like protein n=1 Tax=Actinocorallia herbida TaxID=58109 RepID=A0A3N1DCJ4_9ACTN|nr:hemolysin family protein [Actinocorallia herbida]ROO91231.1 CBS domain containing-hemolysin-like protein [Actinocorallia herbida]